MKNRVIKAFTDPKFKKVKKKNADGSEGHSYKYGRVNMTNPSSITKIIWNSIVSPETNSYLEKIIEEARDFGTRAHSMIEAIDDGLVEPSNLCGELKPLMEHYAQWKEDTKVEVITNELVVFNPNTMKAGTLDKLCIIDGEYWIIDNKFSNNMDNKYKVMTTIQLIIYQEIIKDMVGIDTKLGILHFHKKNLTMDFIEVKETEGIRDLYQSLQRTLRLLKEEVQVMKQKHYDYLQKIYEETMLKW